MYYSQFIRSVKDTCFGSPVVEESTYLGESIVITESGQVFVNETEIVGLECAEEARQYIKQIKLEEELIKEIYEDIPDIKIASLIQEHHNIKVTDTLIESYKELASSKLFSVDPVIQEMRAFNTVTNELEGKIDYVLEDGAIVVIDEDTNISINNLLANNNEIVQYMRESKDNFMHIIRELN